MLSAHDRERPEEGRGAELPDPQARARVRRRAEPAARGHLQVPPRDPRGPRHVRARRRRSCAGCSSGSCSEYTPGDFVEDWDVDGLFAQVEQIYDPSFGADEIEAEEIDRDELTDRLLRGRARRLRASARRSSATELMRNLERAVLLQIIDERWREHLLDMDYLREGIHLRGFAQKDPLVEYKNEGFALFRDLMNSIWEDFAQATSSTSRSRSRRPRPQMALHALVALELDAGSATRAAGPSSPRRSTTPPSRRACRRRTDRGRARSSRRCPRSRRATSTSATRSAATTPAGAARARSTRSATGRRSGRPGSAHEPSRERVAKLRDQLKLLADYL